MLSSLLSPFPPSSIVQTRTRLPIPKPNPQPLLLIIPYKTHSPKRSSINIVSISRASAGGEADQGDRQVAKQPIIIPPPPEAEAEGEGEGTKEEEFSVQLAVVFGLWYFQNVVFNIYNKKVLNVFPYPWLLASFQLLVGSLWMASLWLARLQPFPDVSPKFLLALLGPALFHAVGHISACVSFSKVAVSFTHVIKSSEPVFSVLLSSLLGHHHYPLPVWLSVLLIVAGCSLAALTELSFDLAGFSCALLSNVGFVLRNIYSKRSLRSFARLDGLNLYGCISILSFLCLFPVALLVEGAHWAHGLRGALAAAPPSTLYWWVALSGVFYHLYNQSSYQALDKISPLTFSVGNTMKRVVVIVASVLVFRNPIRPLNALGSGIAVLGTFLYSQATAAKKKKVG